MRALRFVKLLVVAAVGMYLGVVGWMYTVQDQLVYSPSGHISQTPGDVGLGYEDVTIPAGDGIRLASWFIPGDGSAKAVLFLHGNGGARDCCLQHARLFHDLGYAVLLVDYRGYGGNTGAPSEAGLYEDGLAAWDYLVAQRHIAPTRIVVFGQSLGGGVATWLAKQHRPAGLILDSTFTALTDVGGRQYPWLPVGLLSRNRYPSLSRMGEIQAPVLILHSREDGLIPFSQGEELYTAARAPKSLVALRGPHVAGLSSDPATYRAGITQFIRGLALP